jgi:hypothetical protein
MSWPRKGHRRVLEHATPTANSGQGSGETTAVVADSMAIPRLIDRCHLTPSIAGRVRDNTERACILPRIAPLVPRVNIRQAEIYSIGFDKERGDLHHSFLKWCLSLPAP